jgi:hypothetical protein
MLHLYASSSTARLKKNCYFKMGSGSVSVTEKLPLNLGTKHKN